MSGWRTSASPTGMPSPVTTCSTPGGMTSCASSTKRSIVSGVCSAGLMIWTLPAASAGPDLPHRHEERVVPGADAGDDPERLAPDHRRVALDVLAGGLALEVARGAGEEAEVVGHHPGLVDGDPPRLADVQRLEARELLGVLVDDVRELRAGAPCGPWASCACHSLPRLLRRVDRAVDVLGGAARHLGDHLAGRRVQHLHRLAGRRVDELAADEHLLLGHRNAHSCLRSPGTSGERTAVAATRHRAYRVERAREDLVVGTGGVGSAFAAIAQRRSFFERIVLVGPRSRSRPGRRRPARRARPLRLRAGSTRRARTRSSTLIARREGRRRAERDRPALQPADLRRLPSGPRDVPRHGGDALRAAPRAPVLRDARQARRLPVRAGRELAAGGPARARRDRHRAGRGRRLRAPRGRRALLRDRRGRHPRRRRTSSSRATTSPRPSRSGRRSRSASTRP